jgi:AcrR family transcriptional regulator
MFDVMPQGDPGDVAAAPTRRQPGGPAKGDRRRQAIIEAVERLLDERSIADLAVEDIAAAAGISRSGFYFYFESKYAALGETLTEIADAMISASDDFFGGTDQAPEEYVRDALAGVGKLWRDHVALMTAIVEAAHSDAGARALYDDWNGHFIDRIATRIEVERAEGRAPDGPPARDLARTLLVTNLGLFYDDGRRRVSEEEARRTVETLAAVWLAAIWCRSPYA